MADNTDHRRGRKRWRRGVDGERGGVETPKVQTWQGDRDEGRGGRTFCQSLV